MVRTLACAIALCAGSAAFATDIVGAWYAGPTDRYPHNVLGDPIEYDTLVVTLSDGRTLSAHYEATLVFEDTAPRLADVTGDGAPEVVVVESHETQGARLVVWGLRDGHLRQIARTPFIGTRFRWLAPVAIADLDGDGAIEIAYVDRPHLAKTLRIWRYTSDRFDEIATFRGVTNHKIGEDFISGGLRDCGQGPEMILATADWSDLVALRFDANRMQSDTLGLAATPAGFQQALSCN